MAYVGQVPWHGLGESLPAGQPLEVWLTEAGLAWSVLEKPVQFAPDHDLRFFDGHKVLYRSDTQAALSVVTDRYKVVQPREVLEFYRDLVKDQGFQLETAGSLKGGRKVWALARTGEEMLLQGQDKVKAYLLLATAYDGSLATTAQFTSVRVVCNNTLQMAVGNTEAAVRVRHNTDFDANAVKAQLGLQVSAWATFRSAVTRMANTKISPEKAKHILVNLFGDEELPSDDQPKAVGKVLDLFNGGAVGSDLDSAKGTAWGLINSITEHIDFHQRARSQDNRLHSAWFGNGALVKQKAFRELERLAA